MLKVGVTGGIGSGKSVVCRMLEAKGYPVFYSDEEAKELSDNDPQIKKQLIELFGDTIYLDQGLNRTRLAEKIFGNEELRQQVNAIIHPRVRQAFDEFCKKQNTSIIFNEAAILIETGAYKNFDVIVLVSAPENMRIERVVERDGADEVSVRQRMSKQWSDDKKRKFADFEIVNDESQPLEVKVDDMLNYLTSSHGSKSS